MPPETPRGRDTPWVRPGPPLRDCDGYLIATVLVVVFVAPELSVTVSVTT
jgi:hypothetical protein